MPTESLDPNDLERLPSAEDKQKALSVSPSTTKISKPKSLNAYSNVMNVVKTKRAFDAVS